MQQLRPVFSQTNRQIEPEPAKRIRGNRERAEAFRDLPNGVRLGDVGNEFTIPIQAGKVIQKITDINFISGKVTAYGVCINRESHVRAFSIAT